VQKLWKSAVREISPCCFAAGIRRVQHMINNNEKTRRKCMRGFIRLAKNGLLLRHYAQNDASCRSQMTHSKLLRKTNSPHATQSQFRENEPDSVRFTVMHVRTAALKCQDTGTIAQPGPGHLCEKKASGARDQPISILFLERLGFKAEKKDHVEPTNKTLVKCDSPTFLTQI